MDLNLHVDVMAWTLSALLALYEGILRSPVDYPHKGRVMGIFLVFIISLNMLLNEQSNVGELGHMGPVSLRLMTSQFKDIVTHTQKYMTVKCTFCGVWVQILCEISKVPFET